MSGLAWEYHKEVYEAMSRKRIRKIERELSEISSKTGANVPVLLQKIEEELSA